MTAQETGAGGWVYAHRDGNPNKEQHLLADDGFAGVSYAYYETPPVWEAFYSMLGGKYGYIGTSYETEDEAKAAAEEWLGNWSKY